MPSSFVVVGAIWAGDSKTAMLLLELQRHCQLHKQCTSSQTRLLHTPPCVTTTNARLSCEGVLAGSMQLSETLMADCRSCLMLLQTLKTPD